MNQPSKPQANQDSKVLAQEAKEWIASPEGQKKIKEALAAAQEVTSALRKSNQVQIDWFYLIGTPS